MSHRISFFFTTPCWQSRPNSENGCGLRLQLRLRQRSGAWRGVALRGVAVRGVALRGVALRGVALREGSALRNLGAGDALALARRLEDDCWLGASAEPTARSTWYDGNDHDLALPRTFGQSSHGGSS